jgi:hypothetical protein
MNYPAHISGPDFARDQAVLSWLLAGAAAALALAMAILVCALHSQQTSLGESQGQFAHVRAIDEAEIKHLTASNTIAESEYRRLFEAYTDGITALKQLEEAHTKRQALAEQSTKLQSQFRELMMDLLTLAKIDDDAKAIVAKYNISQGAVPIAPSPR